jgi:hypothetical protein
VKVCGVAVAMLPGHSWAPHLLNDSRVNMGTITRSPLGKARRQLMPVWWGGGSVVVRGRESRLHGEGVQHVAATEAD